MDKIASINHNRSALMGRLVVITLVLLTHSNGESGWQRDKNTDSTRESAYQEPTLLTVESSDFSFLILDSIPMGPIKNGNEYRLLPGKHTIQIHNLGCAHFDTTIYLKPGHFVFTRFFPEREGIAPTIHKSKKKK